MSIKSRELKPNKENLLMTLLSDSIDRNAFVCRFVTLCNSVDEGFSIAIDGEWGDGKTFFVKQAKMILDACNSVYCSDLSESDKDTIKKAVSTGNGFQTDEIRPQVCCYYDAWTNDNDIDPLLSLIFAISKDTCEDFPLGNRRDIKMKLAAIADAFSGWDTKSVIDAFQSEDPFDLIKRQKDLESEIVEFFDLILAERGDRLVLFIDELDRCNPIFAVKLLERVKHYLDNDRITFVFSTNIKELQYSVKQYYGYQFDACRYLDRFFDIVISLPEVNMEKYYSSIGVHDYYYSFDKVCKMVAKKFGFTMRESERFFKMAFTCAYKITHQNIAWDSPREHGMSFGNMVIVPILLGLKKRSIERYQNFVTGSDAEPLIEVLQGSEFAYRICDYLLSYNESFDEINDNDVHVDFDERLQAAYNAIFNNNSNEDIIIGRCAFTNNSKRNILTLISMLTSDAIYLDNSNK